MYQIKAQNGYEIHVIGRGDNGLSRVVDKDGRIILEAGYDACLRWLHDRGVSLLARK